MTGGALPPLSCCDYLVRGLLRLELPHRTTEPPEFRAATHVFQGLSPQPPGLTFSNSPMGAGQLVGSWHTHMGVLFSSSSHTLPCLQWWFWQGSGRAQGHVVNTTGSTPTHPDGSWGRTPSLLWAALSPPFSSAEPSSWRLREKLAQSGD